MNSVHPIFEQTRRVLSGDLVREAANKPGPMRAFWVQYVRGGIVEAQFEAMGEDSCAVTIQHMDAANGAAVKVMPLEKWREQIDAAMHADKRANGYDARRIAAAARLEANNPIFGRR